MEAVGGWLWAIIGLGVVVLGLAIVYASRLWQHRRKDAAARRASEEATHENYRRDG